MLESKYLPVVVINTTEAPTKAPTLPVKKDITIDTFNSTCRMAGIGFITLFILYAFLRSRKATWARKLYAPRLFTARIPPRVLPRTIWGWLYSLGSSKASRRTLDEVGLDAFMMNRLLVFCTTAFLCLAPFALFVLLPLYASEAKEDSKGFQRYTIKSLLESDSHESQLWIVVGMTYWNSVVVMFLLHNEYKIFIKHRHEFLRRAAPASYTILVERIPKQLCSRPALLHYFRKIFGNRVVAADVVDNNPTLNYAVKKRLDVVKKLERAMWEHDRSGKRPWRLYFPWMWGQIKQKIEPLGISSSGTSEPAAHHPDGYEQLNNSDEAVDTLMQDGGNTANGEGNQQQQRTVDSENENNIDDDEDEDDDDEEEEVSEYVDSDLDDEQPAEHEHEQDQEEGKHADSSDGLTDDENDRLPIPPGRPRALARENQQQNAGEVIIPTHVAAVTSEELEEERAFLERWQHNMESGLVDIQRSRDANNKRRRKNHCLWILARLNLCMYIDAIKSYERELRVWNRRVRHLQLKALKKRKQVEADAKANVVEPSKQIIHEQLKVRLRQERRMKKGTVSSRSYNATLRRRRSGSAASDIVRRYAQQATNGINIPPPSPRQLSHQQQQQQHHNHHQHHHHHHAVEGRRGSGGEYTNHSASPGENASSFSSTRSRKSIRLTMPWDDGTNALFSTLLSDTRRSDGHGSSISEHGSFMDDDSAFYIDDDADFDDDIDERLFEHAGFDDILRYAVDHNQRTSAFVTFSSLTATMCAAQTVVDRPLRMSISLAPDVRDVLWDNLGLSLPLLALFTWVIRALLLALVLVFGTLTASLAALTNLTYLTKVWPELEDWLETHKEWASVLNQISPMVMVTLYTLVPPLVNLVLKLQRRRSMSETQVEFFRIYYHFLLIQVFLFYMIAGSLMQNIKEIVNHPVRFLNLLGQALPSNELFFLQYLVTRCFLLSFDLLRLSDVCLSFLRGIFKSSKTARERRSPCCGLHTIDHPSGGNTERTISTVTLCFTIGLCYSVICPAMPLVALAYSALALIVYRNQLLYVYTHERESAGSIFPFVFRALLTGVILFQLVMMGIFLLHQSPSSVTLIIPLFFLTLSFMLFCENAYEQSSRFLPLGDASELDIINGPPRENVKYKHPSTLAPAKLIPEPVDTDSFKLMRRASFSVNGDRFY